MAFHEIKGQDDAVEFFRSSVSKERLAHGYLFSGPDGLGKTLLARNLVKFLNCEHPLKDKEGRADCCDNCPACRRIDAFEHPDVHWIQAQKQSKKITIDEIRLIQKEAAMKSYEGKLKVFILQDVQKMTEEAANCLLKTLEEPPRSSLLILIADNLSGLLLTIISRCQVIRFYPLGAWRLEGILTGDYGLAPEEAHFLSCAAEGRIGRALSLKKDGAFQRKNQLVEKISQSGRMSRGFEIFNFKDKKELSAQLLYLLNWFRDILLWKAGLDAASLINTDRLEGLKSSADTFSSRDLENIIDKA